MAAGPGSRLATALRVAAALLGGYAFTWGFLALCVALLAGAGLAFHDAERLAAVLGFLVFPGMALWAFATPSLARAWWVLLGGAAAMTGTAQLIQSALIRSA